MSSIAQLKVELKKNDACRQGSSKTEAVDDRLSLCRWSFDEECGASVLPS